jgi:4-amino-4-deoxy-L-arabinose transferase-like glycosyltransferase
MRAYLVARILAVLAVAVAVARIPWLAARHLRPPMGAEAADLHRLMLYHWGLRDHMGWTWWEQLQRDGFKPPLWYGGVPVLRLGDPTLDLASVMSVNAVILAILAVVIWRAAADMADERTITGPLAAILFVLLPGVAGRFTFAGVEPLHALLLLGWVLLLRRLRRPGLGWALAAGLVLGAGLLAKWNFAAYALGPLVWTVWRASAGVRGRVGLAVGVGLACFAPWYFFAADSAALVTVAGNEASFAGEPLRAALFYPRELLAALGIPGLTFCGASAWVLRKHLKRRGDADDDLGLLASAVASVLLLHLVIPHKEARYLLPVLPLISLAAVLLLASDWRNRRPWDAVGRWVLPAFAVAALTYAPPAMFFTESLRLEPDPDDGGLGVVTQHASFAARPRNVVTFSIEDDPIAPVLTSLCWVLYANNPTPVLARGNHLDLTERSAAFDLERSTHVITSGSLDDTEQASLASMGFHEDVANAPIALPHLPALSLWVLEEGLSPPKRGPGPAPPP